MLPPIQTSPDLADQVYESLLEGICSGDMAPGERFTQEALALRLGVSRQPVLQALGLLRRQGLIVDTENRRGVRVAPMDPAFVAALYDVRAALDALAARSAANRPRPELQAAGQDIVRAGQQAAQRGNQRELVALDMAFHRFVYEASGNPLLLDTAQLHWHHTRRVMANYLARPISFVSIWREHAAILKAIVQGRASTAERLSRDHAERSVRQLCPPDAGQGTEPVKNNDTAAMASASLRH